MEAEICSICHWCQLKICPAPTVALFKLKRFSTFRTVDQIAKKNIKTHDSYYVDVVARFLLMFHLFLESKDWMLKVYFSLTRVRFWPYKTAN